MKIRNPRTLAQQLQRAKMKLLVGLSGHFAPLLPLGFPDRKGNRTMYNAFVRCNMDAVEVNEQMEATINYDRLSFSDGTLTAPGFTVALNKDSGELTFTPKTEERANLWINKEDHFMTGCLTTLGVKASLAMTGWQLLQNTLLNIVVSLAGGLLSTVVIAWLQYRWRNRETGR